MCYGKILQATVIKNNIACLPKFSACFWEHSKIKPKKKETHLKLWFVFHLKETLCCHSWNMGLPAQTGQALPNRDCSDSSNGSFKLNMCFLFKYISLHCQLPAAGSCMRQVCASLQGNSTHPEFIPNLTLEEAVHYHVSPKVIKVATLPVELW